MNWVKSLNSDPEMSEDAARNTMEQVQENANWDFAHLDYVYKWLEKMDESTSTPFAV